MENLKNWLRILDEDIENENYFAALDDVERVKRCLIEITDDKREEILKPRNKDF